MIFWSPISSDFNIISAWLPSIPIFVGMKKKLISRNAPVSTNISFGSFGSTTTFWEVVEISKMAPSIDEFRIVIENSPQLPNSVSGPVMKRSGRRAGLKKIWKSGESGKEIRFRQFGRFQLKSNSQVSFQKNYEKRGLISVSYTHLTLPTKA